MNFQNPYTKQNTTKSTTVVSKCFFLRTVHLEIPKTKFCQTIINEDCIIMIYWFKKIHLLTQRFWVPYWQGICLLNKFQKDFEIMFLSFKLHFFLPFLKKFLVLMQENLIMKVYNKKCWLQKVMIRKKWWGIRNLALKAWISCKGV